MHLSCLTFYSCLHMFIIIMTWVTWVHFDCDELQSSCITIPIYHYMWNGYIRISETWVHYEFIMCCLWLGLNICIVIMTYVTWIHYDSYISQTYNLSQSFVIYMWNEYIRMSDTCGHFGSIIWQYDYIIIFITKNQTTKVLHKHLASVWYWYIMIPHTWVHYGFIM